MMIEYWDYPRSSAGLLVLVQFGVRHGVDVIEILEGSRITRADLRAPDVEIAASQELRVIDNLLRAAGNPVQLGIDAGLEYHFAAFGIWGLGVVSQATGRHAIEYALGFLPLTYAFSMIRFEQASAGQSTMTFDEPDLPSDIRDFVVARDMVASALLLREAIGHEFNLASFEMRPSPTIPLGYTLPPLLGARVKTGASLNKFVIDSALLDCPLPQANPVTAAMCEMMCRQRIDQQKRGLKTGAVSFRYRNADAVTPPSNLKSFARQANMSERTLKRRLKAEGTSFRSLSANGRRAMAETMLAGDKLSISDIAEQLGFSDLSSFSQAFKRWTGQAPSAYRKRIREATDNHTQA